MNTIRKIILPLALLIAATLIPAKALHADGVGEQTRDIIVALFEAFNRHDVEALVALYAEDAQLRSPGDAEPSIGHAAIRENYTGHFDNIPAVHDAVQNIVVEGTRGAVEFVASWDQPNEDDPKARGSLRIASFITVEKGKIVRDITYFDRLELDDNMVLDAFDDVERPVAMSQ